jgi:hypothetical protein
MLIETLAGLVAVRRRLVALRFGDAVDKPLFGGLAFGLAARGALSDHPQIDDLSHVRARLLPKCTTVSFGVSTSAIRANYADTVAGCVVAV